jgi:predicted ABC-type ATPase
MRSSARREDSVDGAFVADLDLAALLSALQLLSGLDEGAFAKHVLRVSPDEYRKKHGRCPPGWQFDGQTCVRAASQSQGGSSIGGNGSGAGGQSPIPPGMSPAVHAPPNSAAAQTVMVGRTQDAATAEKAASDALKKLALGQDPEADLPTYCTGETQDQYAARIYQQGWSANPTIRSMFPDAFGDVNEFIRAFKNSPTQTKTDFSDIDNTDAKNQAPQDLDGLRARLWALNRAEWTKEQHGDEEAAHGLYMQHVDALLQAANREWKSAPPALIAIHKNEDGSEISRVMFAGNERAMIYRALGMPVPVKEIPFKGRSFEMPPTSEIAPIFRDMESGAPLDSVEKRVADMVSKKHGLPKAQEDRAASESLVEAGKGKPAPIGTVRDWKVGQVQKTSKGWVRLPRGGHHLHAPHMGVKNPVVPDKPLPQRMPDSTELPQSQPTPVSVDASAPAQASEMPTGQPPSEEGKIQIPVSTKPWVDHLAGMPTSTRLEHFDKKTRAYKPYRQKLHQRIVESFLEKASAVSAEQTPVALVTMGGPASGKSTIIGVASKNNFVTCDVDAVKEFIPEYQLAVQNRARDAAFLAHHEARDVMQQIRDRAIEDHKNVVLDGTGQHLASYVDMIRRLKKKGYHVKLVMTDVDPETGWNRQHERAEQTGRAIDKVVFDRIYQVVPHNFQPLTQEVSDFEVWNTRGETPKMVWEKQNGDEIIHDPAFVQDFLTKYGRGSLKSEWVEIKARVQRLTPLKESL